MKRFFLLTFLFLSSLNAMDNYILRKKIDELDSIYQRQMEEQLLINTALIGQNKYDERLLQRAERLYSIVAEEEGYSDRGIMARIFHEGALLAQLMSFQEDQLLDDFLPNIDEELRKKHEEFKVENRYLQMRL